MQKYNNFFVVEDVVECGHIPLIGGTIDISILILLDKDIRELLPCSVDVYVKTVKGIIDILDHTSIIDTQLQTKFDKYCDRYVITDSKMFVEDVATIISGLLNYMFPALKGKFDVEVSQGGISYVDSNVDSSINQATYSTELLEAIKLMYKTVKGN